MELFKTFAISFVLGLSTCSLVLSCYPSNSGWGQPQGIFIPKPTLLPKLAAAFHEGKASVHLKPLLFGKGAYHGGKPHIIHHHQQQHGNGLGWGDYDSAVHAPHTKDVKNVYEKGYGGNPATVHEPNSFKNVNYESFGGVGADFGDYGKKK